MSISLHGGQAWPRLSSPLSILGVSSNNTVAATAGNAQVYIHVTRIAPTEEKCPVQSCLGTKCVKGNAIRLSRDTNILFGYRHADDTCQVLFCNFFLYARGETKDSVCEFVRKKLGLVKLLHETTAERQTLLSVDRRDHDRVYDLAKLLVQGEHAIAMNDDVTSYAFANHTNEISYEAHKRVLAMSMVERAWPPRRMVSSLVMAMPISSNQRQELHAGFEAWKMVQFQDDAKTKAEVNANDDESKWLQQVLSEIETLKKREAGLEQNEPMKTKQGDAQTAATSVVPEALSLKRTSATDFKSPSAWLNEVLMKSAQRPSASNLSIFTGKNFDMPKLFNAIEPPKPLPQFVTGDGKPCVAVIADISNTWSKSNVQNINSSSSSGIETKRAASLQKSLPYYRKYQKRGIVPQSSRTPDSIRKEWERQDALDNIEYLAQQNAYIVDGPPVFSSDIFDDSPC